MSTKHTTRKTGKSGKQLTQARKPTLTHSPNLSYSTAYTDGGATHMSTKHGTHKSSKAGKQLTQARKQARALKYGSETAK